jgi:hypothetical protein
MANQFNAITSDNLSNEGQLNSFSQSPDMGGIPRIIYPAKVVSIEEVNGMRRIKARILQLDERGQEVPSKDKSLRDDELVTCIPLLPVYFNVMPQKDEMVLVFLENFGEGSINSTRYYIGPIRSTYYNYDFEEFRNAIRIKDPLQKNIPVPLSAQNLIPSNNQVSINGKKGSNIVLSENEININVALFVENTLSPNITSFGQIQLVNLKDDNRFSNRERIKGEKKPLILPSPEKLSQINIRSNNINFISTEGDNRNIENQGEEVIFTISQDTSKRAIIKYDLEVLNNENIFRFGKEAESLHPLVFGDELIKLISKIIVRLETHIHTPQKPALPDASGLRQDLLQYTIDENGNINRLGELISKFVRTN